MTAAAVSVLSLRKSYAGQRALNDINLDLPAGEIIAIVGPDGAGKTTLLRILAGILDADSGDIKMFGHGRDRHGAFTTVSIGYMPQRFGLYEDLTVAENIAFFADLFSVRGRERTERTRRLLEFSRMEKFTERLAGNLSGGMKQKLGLACALIHNPQILLLDEPTNGVDPVSRREFWRLLYDLNRDGTTVVISSSYMDEAERASRFVLLHSGKVISEGIPAEARRGFSRIVFELEAPDLRAAKESLNGSPAFASVVLFGKTVHLTVNSGVDEADVRRQITAAGLGIDSLRRILPSFEDIYIGLSQEKHE